MRPEPTPARQFASFAIWGGVIGGALCLALAAWAELGSMVGDSPGADRGNADTRTTALYLGIACGVLLVAGVVTRIVDAVVSSRRGR